MKIRIEQKHLMYDLIGPGTVLNGLHLNEPNKQKKAYLRVQRLPEDLRMPMVAIIFGNKVSQVLWGHKSFAFVLESEEIKESFMKYFQYFWKKNA